MKEFLSRHKEAAWAAVVTALVCLVVALGAVVYSGQGDVGANVTYNAQTSSYTDGADFRQNVQAIAEKMANLQQGDVLQVNSSGYMVVVSTTALTSSGLTAGWTLPTTTASNFTTDGRVFASSTGNGSVVLTQNDLLFYNYFSITPTVVADFTFNLPASSTLTTLIPAAGDFKRIIFDNVTGTKQTDLLFADAKGTYMMYSSSTARVMASSTGAITLTRQADTDVLVQFESYSNL